jgi:formate hydrogenlyase transcriptional activator
MQEPNRDDTVSMNDRQTGVGSERLQPRHFYPERRAFDRMLARLAARCMNAPLDKLDREIEACLAEALVYFGGDRLVLWKIAEHGHEAFLTHSYALAGTDLPTMSQVQDHLPYIFDSVLAFKNLCVSHLDDLPPEGRTDREFLERSGVRSFLAIPLLVGGASRGAMTLACINAERTWTNADLFHLQRIGMVLASAIDRQRSHDLIDQRVRFETMIADLSADVLKMQNGKIDSEIERSLGRVAEFFHADRCGLLRVDTRRRLAHVSHAYYAEGVAPVSPDINLVELFPWTYEELAIQKRPVNVTSTQMKNLPPIAQTDRRSWAAMGAKSNLAIPLITGEEVDHVIVIQSLREDRAWPEEYIPRLRLLGELFVNALIRKRSDAVIRTNTARMATVIDVESLGFYEMAVRSSVVYADERMRELLGIPPEEEHRVRDFWFEHIHPDDLPEITEKSRRTLNGEKGSETAEYRYMHPLRGLIWINQSSRAVDTDARGRPVRLVGVFRDITLQKRAEQDLMQSEERLNLAAESAEVALWTMDLQSGALWTTELGKSMFGLPADQELTLERFLEIVHPEDRQLIRQEVQETIRSGNENSVEYRIRAADGSVRWFLSRGRLSSASKERSQHLMGVSIDITKRKQTEEELKTSYAEIARLRDKLEAENRYLREEVASSCEAKEIIGRSDVIKYVHFRVNQVASLDTTVLIVGETGTGKGLVAKAVHDASLRRDRQMIHVNCAVLPANLIESELFGREKGAFTGAQAKQIGRFELAHKGTIFLDEIAELPVELQAKLLRVVETGEFERLGDPHTVKVDVRIIASTNRNLEEEIYKGRFREDLFYRLNVFPITVPPLRQRYEDIPLIVDALIERLNKQLGRRITSVPQEIMQALQSYPWPGNVRELENIIERAVIMSRGPVLQLSEQLGASSPHPPAAPETAFSGLAEVERAHIRNTLEAVQWKIEGPKGAAHTLGVKPSTLRDRMQKLKISRPGSS